MPGKSGSLERAVAGALRAAIKTHGPITLEAVASATAMLVDQIRQMEIAAPAAGAALVRKRWKGTTAEERREAMPEGMGAAGGRSAWAGMTKAQRSKEMKRRAAIRAKKRAMTADEIKALLAAASERESRGDFSSGGKGPDAK